MYYYYYNHGFNPHNVGSVNSVRLQSSNSGRVVYIYLYIIVSDGVKGAVGSS